MKLKGHVTSIVLGTACAVVVVLFAVSSYRPGWRQARPAALAGAWILTLPAGFSHNVRLLAAGESRYRIDRLVFAGTYELRGDRLVMIEPRDPRLTEFVWEVDPGGDLVLVQGPAVEKTGSNYLGARLTRAATEP